MPVANRQGIVPPICVVLYLGRMRGRRLETLEQGKTERKRGLAADLRSLRSKLGACHPLSRPACKPLNFTPSVPVPPIARKDKGGQPRPPGRVSWRMSLWPVCVQRTGRRESEPVPGARGDADRYAAPSELHLPGERLAPRASPEAGPALGFTVSPRWG